MKLDLPKEWYEKHMNDEDGCEIGAGLPYIVPGYWYSYPLYTPPLTGQYYVKWNNGKEEVQQYHNGFITIDEMKRFTTHKLPDFYIIEWKIIEY